jgi:hypothetical protein
MLVMVWIVQLVLILAMAQEHRFLARLPLLHPHQLLRLQEQTAQLVFLLTLGPVHLATLEALRFVIPLLPVLTMKFQEQTLVQHLLRHLHHLQLHHHLLQEAVVLKTKVSHAVVLVVAMV